MTEGRDVRARLASMAWKAIAAGMLARLAWAMWGPDVVTNDAAAYRELAGSLARGEGFATAAGPSAYWPPGWPAWLAIFERGGDGPALLANVALGAFTIVVTFELTRLLYEPVTAALAAVFVAWTPSLVLLPKLLLSENLALPLVVLTVLAIERARRATHLWGWALAGVLCGAATLVREACFVLLLPGVALSLVGRGSWMRRMSHAAVFVIVVVAVLLPWSLRNRATFGNASLTTSGGVNLCIGLGDGATGGYRHVPKLDAIPQEHARGAAGRACAREGLHHHPEQIITLIPAKLSRFVVWDHWEVDDFFASKLGAGPANVLRVACNLSYWALILLAIRGARGNASRLLSVWITAVGFVVLTLLTFGAPRFHMLLVPFLCATAAHGAIQWFMRRSFW